MNDTEPISMEQASLDIAKMMNSDTFYVWRNASGKVVCMVDYKVIDNQAKLSHVYTPVEERGKAYAANLIHDLTAKLLSEGLVPLLYTDYNYPASNKAYINAGYEDTGILINFSCSKEYLSPFIIISLFSVCSVTLLFSTTSFTISFPVLFSVLFIVISVSF